jgi:hypothetical protein
VDLARRPEAPPTRYSVVTPLREPLRQLEASARRRLADLPFLLVDLQLGDERTWETLLRSPPASPTRNRRAPGEDARSFALARGVTVVAWHLVQMQPEHASLYLGISSRVAEMLRGANLLDLDSAASRVTGLLRPRWCDRPSVWMYLLRNANGARGSTRDETVYALQLAGADLSSEGRVAVSR